MPVPRIEDLAIKAPRHGAGSRLWAEWCFYRVCFRHVRLRLLIMAAILLSGALLFMRLEAEKGHSLAQATYYTFSLIFGETPEEFPRPPVLQALFFVVPILGLTVIIEGIVDFALMLRDRRRFERSWCVMLASSFRDHVILVGFGRLGYPVFQILRRLGHAVVIIESDPQNQFLEEARRDGSPLIVGDARREALLTDANVAGAASIIVATDDDLVNLEVALDARKLNSNIRVVLRAYDQNIADKVRDGFNIRLAMSQAAVSAPTFATCALAPATVNSFIVGDRLVATQRWLVRQDGPLSGRTIADVMRAFRVTVIEHERAEQDPVFCPDPDTTLRPGDGLMIQGPIDVLDELRGRAEAMLAARASVGSGPDAG